MDGTVEFPLVTPEEIAAEAWAAMARQDSDEALRLWQRLRQHFPERADGYVWPIQVLWQTGRMDEAEAAAAEALARFPENPDLFGQHAWIAMARQRWDEALQWWGKARSRAPDRAEGDVWAARALWQLGRLDEAEAMAASAVERFRENAAALTEHAWVAVARRDWKQALRRWMLVYRPDPNRLDATVGVVQALRMVGRIDEAEAMATEAVRRLPESEDLAVEHVWVAVARDDWKAAAARLEKARRMLNHAGRFGESLGWVEGELRRHAAPPGAPDTKPRRPAASSATDTVATTVESISTKDLMLSFESLGERCDFGAAQRHYGAEPLGLLRFAYAPFDPLIAALEDRLEAIGTVEDTGFERYKDESILYMKKYGLVFHTFVNLTELNTRKKRDHFRDQQRRRLAFLRDKLASDLEDPQKIYVYSSGEHTSDADAKRLFKALRGYGPNLLLYVRPARRDRPLGTVEVVEDGLFAGYCSGPVDFLAGEQPPFELWRGICEQTYRLAQAAMASREKRVD